MHGTPWKTQNSDIKSNTKQSHSSSHARTTWWYWMLKRKQTENHTLFAHSLRSFNKGTKFIWQQLWTKLSATELYLSSSRYASAAVAALEKEQLHPVVMNLTNTYRTVNAIMTRQKCVLSHHQHWQLLQELAVQRPSLSILSGWDEVMQHDRAVPGWGWGI